MYQFLIDEVSISVRSILMNSKILYQNFDRESKTIMSFELLSSQFTRNAVHLSQIKLEKLYSSIVPQLMKHQTKYYQFFIRRRDALCYATRNHSPLLFIRLISLR